MNIAIVDDEAEMRAFLRQSLSELLAAKAEISCFSDGEAFLAAFAPGRFDLVLLDIFMGSLTGMDVARTIRTRDREVKLVFATSSNEFASESYEVGACYYLRKPITKPQLSAMLDRLDLDKLERLRTLRLPDGTSVLLRDILYADCAGHRVTLHCKSGGDRPLRLTFAQAEALLCAYPYFVSPGKGLVVNFYEISGQTADTFILTDGTHIPISRRKAKEVLDAYSDFRFAQLRKGGGR